MLIKDPPLEIADGFLMLGTNEYIIYLAESGDEAVVFEGGVGAVGPVVAEQIAELAIASDIVKQIIITHAHPDHVMAVPKLCEVFGSAKVCASQAAAGTLQIEKAIGFFTKIDGMLTEALLKAGSIAERHRPKPLRENRIGVDQILAEGDTVTVGDTSFNCLATPGHSDCSLSFHEPDMGILIIGDAAGYYVPEHDWFWPCYFADYGAYLESIRRLASLDAEILCLGHNAVIKGRDAVRACFDAAAAESKAWHERILREVEGKEVDAIGAELGSEVFEKTQLLGLDFFQKNCVGLVKQSVRYAGEQKG